MHADRRLPVAADISVIVVEFSFQQHSRAAPEEWRSAYPQAALVLVYRTLAFWLAMAVARRLDLRSTPIDALPDPGDA